MLIFSYMPDPVLESQLKSVEIPPTDTDFICHYRLNLHVKQDTLMTKRSAMFVDLFDAGFGTRSVASCITSLLSVFSSRSNTPLT